MIAYRNCDRRWPFLWESSEQPAARWHAEDDGPAQYLADTPDGAWAEFLRHEEIVDPADLFGIERALWAVDVPVDDPARPILPTETLRGGVDAYPACQAEARRLREDGAHSLCVESAALQPGTAGGYRVDFGFRDGQPRDGQVYVLFGLRPNAVGWLIVENGRPPAELLTRVCPL